MSTRAIIAYKMPNYGTYATAWCWNDGGPENLGRELRRYFKDKTQVMELIKLHSFSTILGPKSIIKFMHEGDRAVCLSNNRFPLLHPHNGIVVEGRGELAYFDTIEDMLDQDVNYVYIFEDNKWITYK